MTQKREGESDDSPSLCHHSEISMPSGFVFLCPKKFLRAGARILYFSICFALIKEKGGRSLLLKDRRDEGFNQKIEDHYEKQKAFLMAYGSKILGSKEKAEDALQECFLVIIERKADYADLPDDAFRKVAVTMMKYKCIDRLRREKKWANHAPDASNGAFDAFDDLSATCLKKEREKMARDALKKVDPLGQQILYLKYFEEKSYKEIAEALAISTNLVQVKLYRIKQKLRKLLGEEGENE